MTGIEGNNRELMWKLALIRSYRAVRQEEIGAPKAEWTSWDSRSFVKLVRQS